MGTFLFSELGTPHSTRTSDGVPYHIRPIRPDDAARERAFINGLSPQSRYQRFMHNLREPGDAFIEKFVNVDYHRTMALVAVIGEGAAERIIGVARYAAERRRILRIRRGGGGRLAVPRHRNDPGAAAVRACGARGIQARSTARCSPTISA